VLQDIFKERLEITSDLVLSTTFHFFVKNIFDILNLFCYFFSDFFCDFSKSFDLFFIEKPLQSVVLHLFSLIKAYVDNKADLSANWEKR